MGRYGQWRHRYPGVRARPHHRRGPTFIAGQAIGLALSTGPQVPPTSPFGSLATPRKTLVATAAYGAGTYTQALGVTLTIPAMSRVGTYTGTLTTTITSAP